ncbi:mitochondrial grpe [Coprinopsis marcescibilis]|uniref:GrpE protein homolog n=1 Tax=Coprinopsis marcescibilis TaxID=230819 RepID=A0A5C3LBX9_COPMA|nr:mitochondrial grpe [Coprinopsis marcescibilis]
MNLASSLQLFRSCAGASSSRALARSALRNLPPRLSHPRRYYSDDKAAEQSKKSPDQEPATKEGDVSKELTEKLKAKESEVADLKSRLQYLQADYLNLQRNAAKEKEQARDFAITRFASDLLETVDVLSIALKSVPHTALAQPDADSSSNGTTKSHAAHLKDLHNGIEITNRLLLQTLAKFHIKSFDPTGEVFDPNLHEALYQAPVPGKTPGTVIDTQKIGYMIKDRVLRAAQVGVAQDTS